MSWEDNSESSREFIRGELHHYGDDIAVLRGMPRFSPIINALRRASISQNAQIDVGIVLNTLIQCDISDRAHWKYLQNMSEADMARISATPLRDLTLPVEREALAVLRIQQLLATCIQGGIIRCVQPLPAGRSKVDLGAWMPKLPDFTVKGGAYPYFLRAMMNSALYAMQQSDVPMGVDARLVEAVRKELERPTREGMPEREFVLPMRALYAKLHEAGLVVPPAKTPKL